MLNKVSGNKRLIVQGLIGLLLGRVWIYSINPFAVAYFALTLVERKGRGLVFTAILAGMATQVYGTTFVKYILIMLLLWFLDFLVERSSDVSWSTLLIGIGSGTVTLVLGVTNALLSVNMVDMLLIGVLESIALVALINVFQWGVRFLLYENMDKILDNEELISLLAIISLSLYGLPEFMDGLFSVGTTIMYFIVLYVSYRYGASAGAVAGAAGGILASLTGSTAAAIGLYCLLGIGVGMFRQAGRILSSLAFAVMGFVLAFVFQQDIIGVVELRGMISAVIIFLALPAEAVQMARTDYGGEENPFEKEDIRTLANYKMEDFSRAFRRLSKSFSRFGGQRTHLDENEVEHIFNELSEQVCGDCVNCNQCWGRYYQDTYDNVHGLLKLACEEGSIDVLQAGEKFSSRCIRLEDYVQKTNESVAIARMNLGWKNRMAESREAVSRQMFELAGMLRDFTVELEDVKEIDREEKKKILFALRGLGLQIRRLSVRKRRGGKMEIQFLAKRREKNCITGRDICSLLYDTMGLRFRPSGETKNVVPMDFESMCYFEDVNFKVLTGMARVAKSGEKVCGDNFSFLELATGELLMMLSDGMGSGIFAGEDSECLVEVLENLLEAGFHKDSAVRLLNSLFVMSYAGQTFATLDIASIDLYTGEMEVLKNGAAATFIKRGDRVETLYCSALPVGVDLENEVQEEKTVLGDGDIVVMVTDGIIDAFPGEEKEFYVENILANIHSNNPNDIASSILMQALERGGEIASDDMSVLVTGIWEKTGKI